MCDLMRTCQSLFLWIPYLQVTNKMPIIHSFIEFHWTPHIHNNIPNPKPPNHLPSPLQPTHTPLPSIHPLIHPYIHTYIRTIRTTHCQITKAGNMASWKHHYTAQTSPTSLTCWAPNLSQLLSLPHYAELSWEVQRMSLLGSLVRDVYWTGLGGYQVLLVWLFCELWFSLLAEISGEGPVVVGWLVGWLVRCCTVWGVLRVYLVGEGHFWG